MEFPPCSARENPWAASGGGGVSFAWGWVVGAVASPTLFSEEVACVCWGKGAPRRQFIKPPGAESGRGFNDTARVGAQGERRGSLFLGDLVVVARRDDVIRESSRDILGSQAARAGVIDDVGRRWWCWLGRLGVRTTEALVGLFVLDRTTARDGSGKRTMSRAAAESGATKKSSLGQTLQ